MGPKLPNQVRCMVYHTEKQTSEAPSNITQGSTTGQTENHQLANTQNTSSRNRDATTVSPIPSSSSTKNMNCPSRKIQSQHPLFKMRHAENKRGPNTPFKRIKLDEASSHIPTRMRTHPLPTSTKPKGGSTNPIFKKPTSMTASDQVSSIMNKMDFPNNRFINTTTTPKDPIRQVAEKVDPIRSQLEEDLFLSDSNSESEEERPGPSVKETVEKIKFRRPSLPSKKIQFLPYHLNHKNVSTKPKAPKHQNKRLTLNISPQRLRN